MSSFFFIEIFFDFFDVDIIWSVDWKGCNDKYHDSLDNYDVIIFWQTFPSIINNDKAMKGRVFIVPMLDGVLSFSDSDWKKYSSYNFISFTQALHKKLINFGLISLSVTAAPKAPKIDFLISKKTNKKPIVFFWQRVNSINWNSVKRKIYADSISKVFLMLDVDPDNEQYLPSKEDIKNFNIEFVSWFESKQSLQALLKKCDIYIAPRPVEGIGFSFLDAMACGCVIVANNYPSMNEYIDETIGYLVDFDTDEKLNFENLQTKKEKSIAKNHEYIQLWNIDKDKIIKYISKGINL